MTFNTTNKFSVDIRIDYLKQVCANSRERENYKKKKFQFDFVCLKMASQTQGIQQLLTAEKRAAEKVAEARKRKYYTNYWFSPKIPIFFL